MDVEGAEWDALPAMLRDGSLKNVKQFSMEIHMHGGKTAKIVSSLIKELEGQGFRKWLVHYNPVGNFIIPKTQVRTSKLIEIYFINVNFIKGVPVKSANFPKVCTGPILS